MKKPENPYKDILHYRPHVNLHTIYQHGIDAMHEMAEAREKELLLEIVRLKGRLDYYEKA